MIKRWFRDPLYIKWRKAILKRDKHKCQWIHCKAKRKLNVHHIVRWADNPGLRFVEDNGITLCSTHHKMIKNLEHIYAALFMKIVAENKHGH